MKKLLTILAVLLGAMAMNAQNYLYFTPAAAWKNDGACFSIALYDASDVGTYSIPLTVLPDNANVYRAELPTGNYTAIRFYRNPPSDPVAGEENWGWNKTGKMAFSYQTNIHFIMHTVCWAGEGLENFNVTTFDPGTTIEDVVIRVKPIGNNTWTNVYLYTWGPENFGGWPGQQGVAEDGGWFRFTIPATETMGHAIFNNNDAQQFDADNITLVTACYEISLTAATLVECPPSAITDKIQTSFLVYPNPVSTTLNVQCAMCNVQCAEIYDISGKLQLVTTLSQPYPNLVTTINVADLPAGTYFLKIDNQIQKFVKK